MPKGKSVASLLNDEISRIARKEVTGALRDTNKAIASLRKEVAELSREVAGVRKQAAAGPAAPKGRRARASSASAAAAGSDFRFSAKGLKSHRERLGLSAADMGKLIGVTGLSVYNWEAGKTRPRVAQLEKIADVRKMGKREAMARLDELGVEKKKPGRKPGSKKKSSKRTSKKG